MHGITLTKRPADWAVIQQKDGYGKIHLEGIFRVHPAAIEVGVESAVPCYRIMREDDNMPVIPWTTVRDVVCEDKVNFTGHFHADFPVPTGGPYRIETSLQTRSTQPNITWLYRGDCTMHLLVGDVFVIAGQSNSAGHAWDYCPDPPHLCVHLFRNNGHWDLAAHPMNESTDGGSLPNEEMGIPGISPYLSFGKKYYDMTRRPVGLVQAALGGSSIAQWNPESGELYRNMLSRMEMTGGKFAGILWYQGCNDCNPKAASHYLTDFRYMVEKTREALNDNIPFYTVQLNRQVDGISDEGWSMIREAQRKAAIEIPNVSVLATTNLPISDGIHNSAQANLVLGERLACEVAYQKGLSSMEFESPTLKETHLLTEEEKNTLSLTGIWLELSFAHTHRWFVLYSAKGEESGFNLRDEKGAIEIERIRANLEDLNHIYLKLDRIPYKAAKLSFACGADPVKNPIVDAVTYLPPLSFYQVPISL